jgi:hypothetical protein
MEYPKNIKKQEIPAYDFLYELTQQPPDYEPDGKKGPDFLVGGKLAVETTQLMQYFSHNGNSFSIDGNNERIYKTLSSILIEYDNRYFGQTFYLTFTYTAEMPRITPYKNQIKKSLNEFLQKEDRGYFAFSIDNKIEFSIFPGSPSPGKVFKIGASDCIEQGGNPESIYICEINRCLELKNHKLSNWVKTYPCNWLILVDKIGIWDHQINKELIASKISDLGEFSRLLIIGWDRELRYQIKKGVGCVRF